MCLLETGKAIHDHGHNHDHKPRAGRIGRRALLGGGAVAAMAAVLPGPAEARGQRRVRDLTHTFAAGFPVYTGDHPTRETLTTVPNDGFYMQRWTFGEHTGTHMDVPGHFIQNGRLITQITPNELILPVAVVDVSSRVASNPDTQVTVDDLQRYERVHGQIPAGAAVFMHSGWESRLPQGEDAFLGRDSAGVFHFPGFSVDAVRWLIQRRGITSIGVDTVSLDFGPSTTFDVHTTLLGADRYGVENLKGLATIPPKGATVYVGAVPWEEGSGGPLRAIATW
jgi:kynurenine formamidase